MNKVHPKLCISLLCYFAFSLTIYSQNLFKPGFIITIQNDTQNVLIDFESRWICRIKKDGKITEIKPNEILGFGFPGNRYYSAEIIRDTFVEVLITGPLSLYGFERLFYLQKTNQDLVKLEKKPDRKLYNGFRMETIEDIQWKGILRFVCSDCPGIKDDYDQLNLTESDITRKVIQYNECLKKEFIVYKDQLPFIKINPGIGIGMAYSHLTLNRPNIISDIPIHFNTWQTFPLATAEIYSPKVFSSFSLQFEIQYNKFKSRSENILIRPNDIAYYETLYNLDILSTPLLFKYRLPIKNIKFSVIGGIQHDFIFNQNNRLITENFIGQKIYTDLAHSFSFNKSSLGYLVGIETKMHIGRFAISGHLRINPQREKITALLPAQRFTSNSELDRALLFFSISRR